MQEPDVKFIPKPIVEFTNGDLIFNWDEIPFKVFRPYTQNT